jgi:DNA-binding transcriptional ArsR family regulator
MVVQTSADKFLEDAFGSKGRVRVLRVLVEEGEMHISQLSRRTGLNHSSVDNHCHKLKELGLIREKRYGKIRILEPDFNELEIRLKKGHGLELTSDNMSRLKR